MRGASKVGPLLSPKTPSFIQTFMSLKKDTRSETLGVLSFSGPVQKHCRPCAGVMQTAVMGSHQPFEQLGLGQNSKRVLKGLLVQARRGFPNLRSGPGVGSLRSVAVWSRPDRQFCRHWSGFLSWTWCLCDPTWIC